MMLHSCWSGCGTTAELAIVVFICGSPIADGVDVIWPEGELVSVVQAEETAAFFVFCKREETQKLNPRVLYFCQPLSLILDKQNTDNYRNSTNLEEFGLAKLYKTVY